MGTKGFKNEISEQENLYFEVQADMGITKHMGCLGATKELIELCHIDKDKYVLDVGCGVGKTPCYIAKKYGCRVVGVDISERMIRRSVERAKREGLENKVEFRVADAQNLPFENDLFDTVISESVTAFVEDKQRAVNEYVRVAKPGGYIGLNECTWIKTPPPTELVEYVSRTMAKAEFLTSDGWKELLEGSGLTDIVVRAYKVNALSQWIDEIRWFDFRDFSRAWYRFLSQCITSPAYRKFAKETVTAPKSILSYLKYVGYGIYVGRK